MTKYYLKNWKDYFDSGNILEVEAKSCDDGYHTFTELYEHRHALFCALVKIYDNYITPLNSRVKCWKSKFHSDGTMFDGQFIVGMSILKFDGTKEHITYHLPISWWNKFRVIELTNAPKWDGKHNNIERLMRL